MSKYISLENLERYDSKMQERIASFCASKEDGMWRQTEKAGAVSFWPVGNSPLEGTVEFLFTETPPTSGDKSPDNPSAISGVSSISLTVCQEEDVDEHSYTLSLGGTYYGGSIDLATGVMTVTWEGNVLTGNETITTSQTSVAGLYSFTVPAAYYAKTGTAASYKCTHFPAGRVRTDTFRVREVDGRGIIFYMESITSSQDFSNFLITQYNNGTPVTVTYAVKTPYTVQLSPLSLRALIQPDKYVPRLNTVYSDADSVQIVYQKNPVRDKFEKVQAIIAQGGNV